ncbi:hypothetical protein F8M41_015042 [Gigaspora margarita]|uniref:Uncharacterized protein n=1 Tax=Gigaspora margarita TaxID=4874 RepID=A0A8H4B3D4_GIGMA|nr:hypothetical protein F8M41_015042 [Gigaspora margarita]
MMRKKNREEKLLRGNEAPTSQTQETHNTSSDKNQDKSQNKTPQSHKKKGTENIAQVIADVMQDKNLTDSTHVTEISAKALHQNSSTVLLLDLAQLFDKATDAEYRP